MLVKATKTGYDGVQRRREGDIFEVEEKKFSKSWMVKFNKAGKQFEVSEESPKRKKGARVVEVEPEIAPELDVI